MAAGLGFKDFVTGEVLTAADVDGYLMQNIWVFANATARDAAVTSPQEGNACYLKDTDAVMTYSGSAWVTASSPTSYGLSAGKNAIINSAFDVWQRGTSLASTAAYNYYTADRYPFNFGTNTTATISRQLTNDTTNLPFIQYCARMQRNSGATTVANLAIHYTLENQDTNRFIGQSVTFSFYARAGANYSSASNALNIAFASGTGTDQSIANGLTGQTNFITSTATLTTTWQRFTYTGTVPTTAKQIGFFAYAVTSGTAGANDYYEMTGLQLELGSTATAFARNATTSQGELAACQRYYWRSVTGNAFSRHPGAGAFAGSTTNYHVLNCPVQMRVSPTSVDFSNLNLYDYGADRAVTNITLTSDQQSPNAATLTCTVASGGVQYRPTQLTNNNNANGYIGLSAEL